MLYINRISVRVPFEYSYIRLCDKDAPTAYIDCQVDPSTQQLQKSLRQVQVGHWKRRTCRTMKDLVKMFKGILRPAGSGSEKWPLFEYFHLSFLHLSGAFHLTCFLLRGQHRGGRTPMRGRFPFPCFHKYSISIAVGSHQSINM